MAVSQDPPLIRQLDERIANQIAAGEVVERPAAVVKELIENALDAGATRIAIAIEDGGRQVVEVVDDGHGMRRDDLSLALSRHATSKLRSAEDLFRISSLGFRGEALPSIASVSEFTLASCPAAGTGAALRVDGGTMRGVETIAMARGTRVSVRNLFWNVPARLKFLKTARSEGAAVTDMVTRLALGHPAVAFRLTIDGRTAIDFAPGQSLRERCLDTLGAEIANGLIAVEGLRDATQLQGFVAHPQFAKPTAKKQFVYLNGRPVQDRMITAAIRDGFGGFLEPRLHGVVVLYLDTDPSLVDVNVHPTKAEIRFRRQGEVFALIRDSVRDVLSEHSGGFRLDGPGAASGHGGHSDTSGVRRHLVRPAAPPAPSAPPNYQERFLPRQPDTLAAQIIHQRSEQNAQQAIDDSPRRVGEGPNPAPTTASSQDRGGMPPAIEPNQAAHSPEPDLPGVRQVVQLGDMYVLVETDHGIRLLDQHALHEKALYLCLEGHVRQFEGSGRQELLIPQTIDLDAEEMAAVEPHLKELSAAGIEAEVFGPSQLILRAYPSALAKVSWPRFFAELAAEKPGPGALAKLRERLAHRRACTTAVKAGKQLSRAEMLELVRLLYTLEHMEHCPHGRPTTLDLSWQELEQRFQR